MRYRIDGVLYDMEAPPKKVQDAILSRIKVMGNMDIAERRLPQDGRASVKLGDVGGRHPHLVGADQQRRAHRAAPARQERAPVRSSRRSASRATTSRSSSKYIQYNHGILLVTGPTGSGKSTTLYAALARGQLDGSST